MTPAEIGDALKEERKRRGMTQRQVGFHNYMTQEQVRAIEHGHYKSITGTMLSLIDFFGMELVLRDKEVHNGSKGNDN